MGRQAWVKRTTGAIVKVIVDQFLGGQGTCGILGVRRRKGSDMGVFDSSLKTFKSLGTKH